jgi:hypothetical protein
MDLPLHLRVLWRFRVMVAIGLALAVALAVLSLVRVSFAGGLKLTYRGHETWMSQARVFVTRPGFEWGSSITGTGGEGPGNPTKINAQVSQETRLASLASLYASFATSDPVMALIERSGKIDGKIDAAPLPATQNNPYALLPLIGIVGNADTPGASKKLAERASRALVQYIHDEQVRNRVPAAQRIKLTVINRASDTQRVSGRPKALPLLVFILVLVATVAIAFLRENLSPAERKLAAAEQREDTATRKSA